MSEWRLMKRPYAVCVTCNPEYQEQDGERVVYACEACDDLDLDEFEEKRRRRIAEANEY